MITPRLTIPGAALRPWGASDAGVLVQAWRDPDIAAWNPVPQEPTLSTATTWIHGVTERAVLGLALDWVIDTAAAPARGQGAVVGEVGLSGFRATAGLDSQPGRHAKNSGALIGYWLLPDARGLGLATDAVKEVTAWAHGTLDLTVLVARCHRTNHASQRVVERAGYLLGGIDTQDYQLWRSRQ